MKLFSLRTQLQWISGLLIVIASLAAYVPIAPLYPNPSLDGGWAFALNAAVAKGLVFGRDIIFTFGPYAAGYTQLYHPATDTRMLWSTALLGLAFAAGLLCLSRGWERLFAVLLTVALVAVARDTLFLLLPFLFLVLACRVMMPPANPAKLARNSTVLLSLALLVGALGLLPLIKGTFAVASGLAMALAWLLFVVRGEFLLAAAATLIFLLTVPAFWVIAQQPLAQLPAFFIALGPITSGYTEAMSLGGPAWLPLFFLSCCAVLMAIHARQAYASGLPGLTLLIGTLGLLFLAFKEGFVRQDAHALTSAGFLGMVSVIMAFGTREIATRVGLAAGVIGWLVIDGSMTGLTPASAAIRIEAPFLMAGRMLDIRFADPGELGRKYKKSLALIRAQHVLPNLDGNVDIYSVGQSAVLAQGLDWSPRPVLQSYSAYTHSLALADADHLTGASAPANVIFSVEPFGDRLPALDDAASWPALLNNYEITGFHDNAAILRKREAGGLSFPAGKASLDGIFGLGDRIALPAGRSPLWAQIDVEPTLLGRLFGILYKPPSLRIAYQLVSGDQQDFRYVSGMGHGFLAAPLVSTTSDVVALKLPGSAEYFASRRPLSISLSAAYGAGWLWRKSFHVSLFPIVFPAQPGIDRLLFDPINIESARRANLPTTPDCTIDLIDRHPIGPDPVEIGKYLRVDGWSAISIKDGLAPDAVTVTLKSFDGVVQTIPAKIVARDDVNLYFGKSAMGPIGYVALADLPLASGAYSLGLEVSRGGRTWLCTTAVPVHLNNAPAQ